MFQNQRACTSKLTANAPKVLNQIHLSLFLKMASRRNGGMQSVLEDVDLQSLIERFRQEKASFFCLLNSSVHACGHNECIDLIFLSPGGSV